MTAAEIIALLELEPHPEGGWYRQTFEDTRPAYVTAQNSPDAFPEILTLASAHGGGVERISQLLLAWVAAHKRQLFKVREGDVVIEINPRTQVNELTERLLQLQIFARQQASSG